MSAGLNYTPANFSPAIPQQKPLPVGQSVNGVSTAPINYSPAVGGFSPVQPTQPAPGQVLGMSTGPFQATPPTPISIPTGGSGGGGASGGGQLALIQQRKNDLIGGATERYQGEVNDLDKALQMFQTETGQNKDYVNQQKGVAITSADQGAQAATSQARQAYLDAVVQNRQRIRATGAGSSSAGLELFNVLDRELQGNLNNVNTQHQGLVGNANMVAQKALNDLENSLNKFVAQTQSSKDQSLREKNDAVKQAEFSAADAALQVQQWAAQHAASSNAANAAAAAKQQQSQLVSNYVTDINKAGADPTAVQKAYAPLFAQYGVNPGTAQSYASFGQPAQDSPLAKYTGMTGTGLDDNSIQFLLNYGKQPAQDPTKYLNFNTNANNYQGGYSVNPALQLTDPSSYQQLLALTGQGQ